MATRILPPASDSAKSVTAPHPDDDCVGMVCSLLNGAMALYPHHEPREKITEHITKATCYFDEKAAWTKAGERVSPKAVRKTIAYIEQAFHEEADHPTPCVRALLLEAQRLLSSYGQTRTDPPSVKGAVNRAEWLLSEILEQACMIRQLMPHLTQSSDDPELEAAYITCINSGSDRIGWLADLAMQDIGCPLTAVYAGNAERWMLPPTAQRAAEAA